MSQYRRVGYFKKMLSQSETISDELANELMDRFESFDDIYDELSPQNRINMPHRYILKKLLELEGATVLIQINLL